MNTLTFTFLLYVQNMHLPVNHSIIMTNHNVNVHITYYYYCITNIQNFYSI